MTDVLALSYPVETAIKMGVRPRAEINTASEAESYLKLGVKDFCLSTDVTILRSFYRQEGGALRELVAQSAVGQGKAAVGV